MRRAAFLALIAAVAFGACTKQDPAGEGPLQQKAGEGASAQICFSGLTQALIQTVSSLHFQRTCSKDSDSGKYVRGYVFKGEKFDGRRSTLEDCIDAAVTSLNSQVSFLEVGLNERCVKPSKQANGERFVWAYDYRGK